MGSTIEPARARNCGKVALVLKSIGLSRHRHAWIALSNPLYPHKEIGMTSLTSMFVVLALAAPAHADSVSGFCERMESA